LFVVRQDFYIDIIMLFRKKIANTGIKTKRKSEIEKSLWIKTETLKLRILKLLKKRKRKIIVAVIVT